MDDIVSQIRALAGEADTAGRVRVQDALRQVLSQLESPQDTLVQLLNAHLRIAAVRLGIGSGLFKSLSQSQHPLQVAQLAAQLCINPQMLARIVRYLASNGLIDEVGVGEFKANKSTHIFSDRKAEAFVYHAFDVCGPAVQVFPDFLDETGYADITSNTKTPFQKAFNTDLACFAWLSRHPKLLEEAQQVMKAFQSGDWAVGFDLFEKEAIRAPKHLERVFLVDVGGGHGHQCVEIRNKFPNLNGQLVLQDLPEVLNGLPDIPGVKIEAHDFFQEQTVKGARFYYLRRILHDWPDTLCIKILQNLRSAMADDSQILIDEVVLPDTKVPWQSTMADLMMMVTLGGKERSQEQWRCIAEQSGLLVEHIHKYHGSATFNSVVVLVAKGAFERRSSCA
ncbi:O-methyltransferase-domain-containing protein [Aspergillus lucknowensis]|uniref:O-methyltransferase-domain-containing protein n=1 Tax=Aspergillus lucknowensis TaxID=176173 RepID=A0ABR4LMR9_9EURO